jgi:hypothetical protein
MSWSETFRDRYYEPGYVYIAGSLTNRVLKIGTTINIRSQEKRLRRTQYGSIDDWVLLYHVWVDEGGKIEHDARRVLRRYRDLRMYDKEGHRQKGREIVDCRFGIALEALTGLLDDGQRNDAWKSRRTDDYEFGWTPPPPEPPPYVPPPPPVGIPAAIHLLNNVDQLELSVRTSLCLKNENIRFIGELVQKSEAEMLRVPNFGRKSLNELKEVLAQIGLHFDKPVPAWPPENIENLSRQATRLFDRVDDLVLSVRSFNCLKNDGISYIGELVQKSEAEMLRISNFGRKSLNEIREVLAQDGLEFGMDLSKWPLAELGGSGPA